MLCVYIVELQTVCGRLQLSPSEGLPLKPPLSSQSPTGAETVKKFMYSGSAVSDRPIKRPCYVSGHSKSCLLSTVTRDTRYNSAQFYKNGLYVATA